MFETADSGTLSLNEVGELPLNVQPKLLRFFKEGTIRRVGDNREKLIDARDYGDQPRFGKGRCRRAFPQRFILARVNVIHLNIPPLRERAIDVPLLVEHFLTKIAKKQTAALDCARSSRAADGSFVEGNVRELENILERAIARAA